RTCASPIDWRNRRAAGSSSSPGANWIASWSGITSSAASTSSREFNCGPAAAIISTRPLLGSRLASAPIIRAEGAQDLAALKSLKSLNLSGNKITVNGVKERIEVRSPSPFVAEVVMSSPLRKWRWCWLVGLALLCGGGCGNGCGGQPKGRGEAEGASQ